MKKINSLITGFPLCPGHMHFILSLLLLAVALQPMHKCFWLQSVWVHDGVQKRDTVRTPLPQAECGFVGAERRRQRFPGIARIRGIRIYNLVHRRMEKSL